MPVCFVGTSGFASPSVRIPGRAASAWELLAYYAERFSAVEMDATFTRYPSAETVKGWADAAGPSLTFTVHMSRIATHVQRLADPQTIADCIETLAPLGKQLACVVFAIPHGLPYDAVQFREALAATGDVRSAWELRDPAWARREVTDLLAQHDAAPVAVETLDGISGFDPDSGFAYVRCRRERYSTHDIAAWGERLESMTASGRDAFVFFRQGPEALAYATAMLEVLG